MLNVTFLKVKHSGKSEAKKLQEYIKRCDVFSPEAAYSTELESVTRERSWRRDIASGRSRAAMKDVLVGRVSPECTADVRAYIETVWDLLYQSKRPIFYLERFREKQTSLEDQESDANVLREVALQELSVGNIEEFLYRKWEGLQLEARVTKVRDEEMAHTIDSAEDDIRQANPRLPYVAQITAFAGAFHVPERYARTKIIPVSLLPGEKIPEALIEARLRGLPFEETKIHMLRVGASNLIDDGLLPFVTADVEQMEYGKLVEVLSKCPYTK